MKRLLNETIVSLLFFLGILMPASSVVAADNWQRLYPDYPTHGFDDIYVQASNNVFAVGTNGLIYHYNGSSWSEMESPVAVDLRAVWGRAANDVFAVGNEGIIIHYDGVRWQKMASPTSSDLYCVWGFSESGGKVYAGGRNGNILLYSAGNWSYMDTPFSDGIWKYSIIHDIWGASPTELYAVGWGTDNAGTFDIFLSNSGGNSWTDEISTYPGSTVLLPESVMGFSGGDVYIGGGEGLYRLQQGNWGSWEQILSGRTQYNGESWSRKIWGTSNASVWFVGGDDYSPYPGGPIHHGSLIHYDGDTSSIISTTPIDQFSASTAISGTSGTDLFISGWEGMILHAKDGVVSSMTMNPHSSMSDICGTTNSSLYAVGDGGAILSYDGNFWRPMASPTNKNLYAVCGTSSSMFAAGADGTVLHFNGSTWSAVASGTTEYLWDIWCLPGDSSALVVGSQGTILVCTAQACSSQTTDGTTEDLYAVHHSDLGSFAAGEDGILMQKNTTNNTWEEVTGTSGDTPANDIFDLWGDAGAGILVAAGDDVSGHSFIHTFTVTSKQWTEKYEGGTSNSQTLRKIAGTEYSNLYVIGNGSDEPGHSNDGIVLHQENGSFSPVKYFSNHQLRSTWMVSDELWVGTSSPTFFHYNGTQWLSTGETPAIQAIGGSDVNNLFVVGDQGLIMRYNGTSWTGMDSGTVNDYFGSVYVTADGSWALAGSGSRVFRYDGSGWSPVTAALTGANWSDFWGAGDRVFAAGDGGILTSNDSGQNWQSEPIPDSSSSSMSSIWGAGYNGPFFASGSSWDGSRSHSVMLIKQRNENWTAMDPDGVDYIGLGDIWGNAADNVYVVGETYATLGENETEILHFNGSDWQQVFYRHNVDPPQSFHAIIGSSKDDVFAFGSTAYSKDQCSSSWDAMHVPGIPVLKSVWGVEGTDGYYYLFGVGESKMGIGDSVYQYKFSINKKCSSPWSLFLPAILSRHQ